MNTKPLYRLFLALLPIAALFSAQLSAKPVEKIIALSPHSVELLFSLGVGDRVVATTDHADYPVVAKNIESIGGYNGISIERIVEINPDVLVVWQSGNRQDQVEQLEKLGLNLHYTHPQTLDDVAEELIALGKLTGTEEKAKALAAKYRNQLSEIKARYANKKPVKTFYQLWSQPLRTAAGDSWLQQLLDVCNADNIFADSNVDYPQVSVENVIIGQPEVIVIPESHGSQYMTDHINWAHWPEIPAIKNGHLNVLNGDLLHRSTLRAIDGLESLCAAIDKAR